MAISKVPETWDHEWPIYGFGEETEESAKIDFVNKLNEMCDWQRHYFNVSTLGTTSSYTPAELYYDSETDKLMCRYTLESDETKEVVTGEIGTMRAFKTSRNLGGWGIDLSISSVYLKNDPGYIAHPSATVTLICSKKVGGEHKDYLGISFANYYGWESGTGQYWWYLYYESSGISGDDPPPRIKVGEKVGMNEDGKIGIYEYSTFNLPFVITPGAYAPSFQVETHTIVHKYIIQNGSYKGWTSQSEHTVKRHIYTGLCAATINFKANFHTSAVFNMLFHNTSYGASQLPKDFNYQEELTKIGYISNGSYTIRALNKNDWHGAILSIVLYQNQSITFGGNLGEALKGNGFPLGFVCAIQAYSAKGDTIINFPPESVEPPSGHVVEFPTKTYYIDEMAVDPNTPYILQYNFTATRITNALNFTLHAGHGMGDEKCCCCNCEISPEEKEQKTYEVHVNFKSEEQISDSAVIQQTTIKSEWEGNILKLWLKDGDKVTVLNVPIGTEYEIEIVKSEEYDECDNTEYIIEPSSGVIEEGYDPETAEGNNNIELNVQTGETVQQYLDRLRQRGYEQLAENLKLENVEFTLQDERIKLGDLVTVDLPEFDFKAVVRVTGVKIKSQGNQTIRTISVGTPLKILRRSKI